MVLHIEPSGEPYIEPHKGPYVGPYMEQHMEPHIEPHVVLHMVPPPKIHPGWLSGQLGKCVGEGCLTSCTFEWPTIPDKLEPFFSEKEKALFFKVPANRLPMIRQKKRFSFSKAWFMKKRKKRKCFLVGPGGWVWGLFKEKMLFSCSRRMVPTYREFWVIQKCRTSSIGGRVTIWIFGESR